MMSEPCPVCQGTGIMADDIYGAVPCKRLARWRVSCNSVYMKNEAAHAGPGRKPLSATMPRLGSEHETKPVMLRFPVDTLRAIESWGTEQEPPLTCGQAVRELALRGLKRVTIDREIRKRARKA
jgi:hypothetical protein